LGTFILTRVSIRHVQVRGLKELD